jgi:hypothetical protein
MDYAILSRTTRLLTAYASQQSAVSVGVRLLVGTRNGRRPLTSNIHAARGFNGRTSCGDKGSCVGVGAVVAMVMALLDSGGGGGGAESREVVVTGYHKSRCLDLDGGLFSADDSSSRPTSRVGGVISLTHIRGNALRLIFLHDLALARIV